MPYPIWSHAADCVSDLIQRNTILTEEQDRGIRNYIRGIPVRCVVDLLMTLTNNDYTMGDAIFAEDAMELNAAFVGTTAHADHHMVILNNLRVILGQTPWFPSGSAMSEYAARYFQYTQDTEEHVGFDPDTHTALYTILTEFSDSDDTDEDDSSTVTTVLAAPAAPADDDAQGETTPVQDDIVTDIYDDDSDDDSDGIEGDDDDSDDETIPLENDDLADFLANIVVDDPEVYIR